MTATVEIVSEALTRTEAAQLEEKEAAIQRGWQTYVQVGEALAFIRDKRLYREKDDTFEQYCLRRWGHAVRWAYQQMEAAAVVENVRNCAQTPAILPANEAQARELAKLPAERQPEAWGNVVEMAQGMAITAKDVRAEVNRRLGKPDKPDNEQRAAANVNSFMDASPAPPAERAGVIAPLVEPALRSYRAEDAAPVPRLVVNRLIYMALRHAISGAELRAGHSPAMPVPVGDAHWLPLHMLGNGMPGHHAIRAVRAWRLDDHIDAGKKRGEYARIEGALANIASGQRQAGDLSNVKIVCRGEADRENETHFWILEREQVEFELDLLAADDTPPMAVVDVASIDTSTPAEYTSNDDSDDDETPLSDATLDYLEAATREALRPTMTDSYQAMRDRITELEAEREEMTTLREATLAELATAQKQIGKMDHDLGIALREAVDRGNQLNEARQKLQETDGRFVVNLTERQFLLLCALAGRRQGREPHVYLGDVIEQRAEQAGFVVEDGAVVQR